MINNDALYDSLFAAAETIYQYVDRGKGFYSGKIRDEEGGWVSSWNHHGGARYELESKLNRSLTKQEITMLSLAIGDGPTPALTPAQRRYSFDYLWPNGYTGTYVDLMRVVTGL